MTMREQIDLRPTNEKIADLEAEVEQLRPLKKHLKWALNIAMISLPPHVKTPTGAMGYGAALREAKEALKIAEGAR